MIPNPIDIEEIEGKESPMKRIPFKIPSILLTAALLLTLCACSAGTPASSRADDPPQPISSAQPADASSAVTPSSARRSADDQIKITPTAAQSVQLERYETADFSITIPKGWSVTTGGINMYHTIRVTDPNEPLNQLFVLLKADVLLHSQAGKNAWQSLYNMGSAQAELFTHAPVLENPSTEGFFQIFPQYVDFAMAVESTYAGYAFPQLNNFTVTERFASVSNMQSAALGDELLRATFTDGTGEGEGLFTASVVDFGSYAISNGQVVNYQLQTVDGGYYMAYNVIALTAAKDTLIEWEPILTQCMNSLQYSDSFVTAANQASNAQAALSQQISRNFNQTMDGIMSSWEARSKSQDIMSQKQSDATLGYERVYDTETNEIYRATNGFTDVYDGNRFQPVTDDRMYADAISGYIEKTD